MGLIFDAEMSRETFVGKDISVASTIFSQCTDPFPSGSNAQVVTNLLFKVKCI